MAHNLTRSFHPIVFSGGISESTNSGATQPFRVRKFHAERLGQSSPQPTPLFLVPNVQQGSNLNPNQIRGQNINVQVSSSHTYLEHNGFPAELFWRVKKHVKEMEESLYERTLTSKIEMFYNAYIMFWQRVQVRVRHGWLRTWGVVLRLVGIKDKRTVSYDPWISSGKPYAKLSANSIQPTK